MAENQRCVHPEPKPTPVVWGNNAGKGGLIRVWRLWKCFDCGKVVRVSVA